MTRSNLRSTMRGGGLLVATALLGGCALANLAGGDYIIDVKDYRTDDKARLLVISRK